MEDATGGSAGFLPIDEDLLYGLGPDNGSDWLKEGMRNVLQPPPSDGVSDWMKAGMQAVGEPEDIDGLQAIRVDLSRASGRGPPAVEGGAEECANRHEVRWQEAETVAARWIRQNNFAMDEHDISFSDSAIGGSAPLMFDDENWLGELLKDTLPQSEAEDATRAYPGGFYVGGSNPETGKKEDRSGRLTFEDGTEYFGGFVDGLRHGEGAMTYADGSKYQGSWVAGKRHGNGALVRTDGSSYAGGWHNDTMEGAGRWAWPTPPGAGDSESAAKEEEHTVEVVMREGKIVEFNGEPPVSLKDDPDEYNCTGDFVGGQGAGGISFTGTATIEYSNGDSYSGEWKDGLYDGQGTFVYPDGLGTYTGGWKAGERHGEGTLTYARSGNTFSGTWVEGKRCGEGTLTWATGARYVGGWTDDMMAGVGTMTRADGSWTKYEYENGRPGKLLEEHVEVDDEVGETPRTTGEEGNAASGGDLNSLLSMAIASAITTDHETGLPLEGRHTVSSTDGTVYDGEFVRGVRHGQGKETVGIKGDAVYEGSWVNNMREGQGKLTYYDVGLPGKGGSSHATGGVAAATTIGNILSTYEGEWKADKKHGIGVFTYSDGTWVKAKWIHGIQELGEPLESGGFVPSSRKHGDDATPDANETGEDEAWQQLGTVVVGQGAVCGGVAETPADTVIQASLEREIETLGETLKLMSERVLASSVDQDGQDGTLQVDDGLTQAQRKRREEGV
eukprot:COSAG05_NODE_985_length_6290_cov_2.922953_1_plen_729_part_00